MKQGTTILLITMFLVLVVGLHFDLKRTLDTDFIDNISRSISHETSWVGKTAPDFELPLLDGDEFKLSDHIGKEVIILNFFATWCGPCNAEMPELAAYHESVKDKAVFMLGIDAQEKPEKVRSFFRKYEAYYPAGIDDDDTGVGDLYGVTGYPTTVLIGVDGKIKLYEVGPITNADVALGTLVNDQLDLLEKGEGVSFSDYSAMLQSEDFPDMSKGPYSSSKSDDRPKLTGRAKEISEKAICMCGCDDTIAKCGCSKADKMAKWLAHADMEGKTDEEVIAEMNRKFCDKKED